MKKLFLLFITSIFVLTLTACGDDNNGDGNVIYVTVYPMQYLIEEIAGDTVTVKRVPGSNVHSEGYDWTAKEQIDMVDSDLLFYTNAGVDTYIPNNKESLFDDGDVQLVDMSQHVEYNVVCYTHSHDEETSLQTESDTCNENSEAEDPHFWLDPVRMLQAAEFVKDKLISTYPDNQELYNNNYTVLNAALEKLNDDFQAMADLANRPIITSTMLFTYWHVRYEIDIISITNDIHTSEIDPGDIIDVIDDAIRYHVHYIMFEKNTNSPDAETVLLGLQAEDPTASSKELHGLGNITTEEAENGSNYITIMYDNLEVLNLVTK